MNGKGHVEAQIEACLDGRLTAAEAAEVRSHCAACAECARAWAQHASVHAALALGVAPPAPRPAWPALQAYRRRAARGHGLLFAWSGAAAGVAALMLGYLLGVAGAGAKAVAGPEELALGTLWGDAQPTTLDGIYLVAGEDLQ